MLDARTITDKYSVAEYALIYLGRRQPSPTVTAGIRYCVEEVAGYELYKDKNHEVMIFDSEAQAFEFRQILGGVFPVLAFMTSPYRNGTCPTRNTPWMLRNMRMLRR
ncbi:MAG: hypothetical protein ACYCUJ_03050 [Acidithiobacillus sp.]